MYPEPDEMFPSELDGFHLNIDPGEFLKSDDAKNA